MSVCNVLWHYDIYVCDCNFFSSSWMNYVYAFMQMCMISIVRLYVLMYVVCEFMYACMHTTVMYVVDTIQFYLIQYHSTISASSSCLSCCTQVGKPSPTRGFWFGNSPAGNCSSSLYWVTQRLCLKKSALLRNFASEPARGRQFDPGTSLYPVNCPVLFTERVLRTYIHTNILVHYSYI